MTIYEISALVNHAQMAAMTPLNTTAAFQATGIYPFNRDIFCETDFSPSLPTGREQNSAVAANDTETNPTLEDAGPLDQVPDAEFLSDDIQPQKQQADDDV